ncbi:unnamed protein product [Amoebophrya sp. A120]|nr:unnamed protein product [Amoebophrya sp. A120]|eukprot:GSA120T00001162001.1
MLVRISDEDDVEVGIDHERTTGTSVLNVMEQIVRLRHEEIESARTCCPYAFISSRHSTPCMQFCRYAVFVGVCFCASVWLSVSDSRHRMVERIPAVLQRRIGSSTIPSSEDLAFRRGSSGTAAAGAEAKNEQAASGDGSTARLGFSLSSSARNSTTQDHGDTMKMRGRQQANYIPPRDGPRYEKLWRKLCPNYETLKADTEVRRLPSQNVFLTGRFFPDLMDGPVRKALFPDAKFLAFFDNLATDESIRLISAFLEEQKIFHPPEAQGQQQYTGLKKDPQQSNNNPTSDAEHAAQQSRPWTLLRAYREVNAWSFRADIWRIAIIYACGGLYLDAKATWPESRHYTADMRQAKSASSGSGPDEARGPGAPTQRRNLAQQKSFGDHWNHTAGLHDDKFGSSSPGVVDAQSKETTRTLWATSSIRDPYEGTNRNHSESHPHDDSRSASGSIISSQGQSSTRTSRGEGSNNASRTPSGSAPTRKLGLASEQDEPADRTLQEEEQLDGGVGQAGTEPGEAEQLAVLRAKAEKAEKERQSALSPRHRTKGRKRKKFVDDEEDEDGERVPRSRRSRGGARAGREDVDASKNKNAEHTAKKAPWEKVKLFSPIAMLRRSKREREARWFTSHLKYERTSSVFQKLAPDGSMSPGEVMFCLDTDILAPGSCGLTNNLIASYPRNPALLYILRAQIQNVMEHRYDFGDDVTSRGHEDLFLTGPGLVTSVVLREPCLRRTLVPRCAYADAGPLFQHVRRAQPEVVNAVCGRPGHNDACTGEGYHVAFSPAYWAEFKKVGAEIKKRSAPDICDESRMLRGLKTMPLAGKRPLLLRARTSTPEDSFEDTGPLGDEEDTTGSTTRTGVNKDENFYDDRQPALLELLVDDWRENPWSPEKVDVRKDLMTSFDKGVHQAMHKRKKHSDCSAYGDIFNHHKVFCRDLEGPEDHCLQACFQKDSFSTIFQKRMAPTRFQSPTLYQIKSTTKSNAPLSDSAALGGAGR